MDAGDGESEEGEEGEEEGNDDEEEGEAYEEEEEKAAKAKEEKKKKRQVSDGKKKVRHERSIYGITPHTYGDSWPVICVPGGPAAEEGAQEGQGWWGWLNS